LAKDLVTPPPVPVESEVASCPDWEVEEEPSEPDEAESPALTFLRNERSEAREYPRPNENLPELPPEQARRIDEWWAVTEPLYKAGNVDAVIQRIETALAELPDIFVYLWLNEELLFELGADLARAGRMPEYVALLKRLRAAQRMAYSFSHGAYDVDVISELVLEGKVDEIPAFLDLFREYPDAQPDYCEEVCELLAWRGVSEPLRLLCDAVAGPMANSPQVIAGGFAFSWRIRVTEGSYFERGDASFEAARSFAGEVLQLGKSLGVETDVNPEWFQKSLDAFSTPPSIDLGKERLPLKTRNRLHMSFIAYLRRNQGFAWVTGCLLADHLDNYFFWCADERKNWAEFALKDIESFLVRYSRRFLASKGVRVLSMIQALFWFGEYLCHAGVLPPPERDQLRARCEALYEKGRGAVEATDVAYRICPSFQALTAVPKA
jgi:hypothetical protein